VFTPPPVQQPGPGGVRYTPSVHNVPGSAGQPPGWGGASSYDALGGGGGGGGGGGSSSDGRPYGMHAVAAAAGAARTLKRHRGEGSTGIVAREDVPSGAMVDAGDEGSEEEEDAGDARPNKRVTVGSQ
jgi:hypothetical protein